MTEWANQVYRDIFHEEAPWTTGTPEERQAAWDKWNADAEKIVLTDEEFQEFRDALERNREQDRQFLMTPVADAA